MNHNSLIRHEQTLDQVKTHDVLTGLDVPKQPTVRSEYPTDRPHLSYRMWLGKQLNNLCAYLFSRNFVLVNSKNFWEAFLNSLLLTTVERVATGFQIFVNSMFRVR